MKPVLLIMAAGMGSRYGGLKQIDPIGPNGEVIIDYSLYDAKKAGFTDIYFVIKHEIEEDFKKIIEKGAGKHLNIHYLYQDINNIPEGFSVPKERVKPWGTGHAVLTAKGAFSSPFAVINADDYYGPEGFKLIYDYLSNVDELEKETSMYQYCMVSFNLKNTITENGTVARGVCEQDSEGNLISITERTKIKRNGNEIQFTEDDVNWTTLDDDTLVSMNLFGFSNSFLDELDKRFSDELKEILKTNPLKGEYFLPKVVSELIEVGKAKVRLLNSKDKWYGITYKDDKESIVKAIASKIAKNEYPNKLW